MNNNILEDIINLISKMMKLAKITNEKVNKLESRLENMLTILTNTISVMQLRINELEGKKQ